MKTNNPTFWAKTEKIPGNLFNKHRYVKGDIPNTRYVILFNLRTETRRISFSKSLYDSKEDCFAECDELDVMYKYHPLPILTKEELKNKYTGRVKTHNVYDYTNGKSWWGYIVLDFELCQIIRIGGYGFYVGRSIPITNGTRTYIIDKMRIANTPECRDYFFRDVDKVPDAYEFDTGEYEGWLQYKWGDGKNAIDYVAPPKQKKPKVEEPIEEDTFDDEYDNYEADLLEDKFADLLDKKTRKNLMEKYGW